MEYNTLNTENNLENKRPEIIVSLTTIPEKFDYLKKSITSILNQTAFNVVKRVYINLDDSIASSDFAKYDYFKTLNGLEDKIVIQKADCRWRSANKLMPVYKEHHDDIIITFDDDKDYPPNIIELLLRKWTLFPNCIIATEVNPVFYIESDGTPESKPLIQFTNIIDIKLEQLQWGKYLSNACLFCPNAFGSSDEALQAFFDYDNFSYITNAVHDELWFWIMSTLQGVQCIGLAETMSFELDGITYEKTKYDLSNINNKKDEIEAYNKRINEVYGEQLCKMIKSKPVVFFLTPFTSQIFVFNARAIHTLYRTMDVVLSHPSTLAASWIKYIVTATKKLNWALKAYKY